MGTPVDTTTTYTSSQPATTVTSPAPTTSSTASAPTDPRAGLQPWEPSGNDALDKERGKGIYYVPSGTSSGSGSIGSGPTGTTPPPPPPPSPILPVFQNFTDTRYDIKVAPIDTVVFDQDQLPVQLIQELLYEELGGVELANMSRTDLIDGQGVSYSAIANLLQINRMYNPNNIVSSGATTSTYFSTFPIDLLSRGINVPEFDADGNIVIRIDDMNNDELIEYQISVSGTINEVD